MLINNFKYSYKENMKIGDDTLIFNMGASMDCPSAKLGLCPIANICYAKKREKQFPTRVLPARRYQQGYWLGNDAKTIGTDIQLAAKKHQLVKFVRFNEASDFHSQDCVDKLSEIARLSSSLVFYGYTHRRDLDFSNRPSNLIIQGSGWMIDNEFKTVSKEVFENTKGYKCPGKCQGCMQCKMRNGYTILVAVH